MNANYDDKQIVDYRKEIVKTLGLSLDVVCFYDTDMPLITFEEVKNCSSSDMILSLISEDKITEEIYIV